MIMNLVEKIPDLEQDMIERYIYDYAVRDDDYLKGSFAGVDYVLRHWSAAKSQYLYKLFGEQLILKKKISYDKDNYKIRSEICDFMWNSDGVGHKFVNAFSSWINQYAYNNYLNVEHYCTSSWWDGPNPTSYANTIHQLINHYDLADNYYGGSKFELLLPNGKKMVIQTGCKIMKTLAKIAEIFSIPYFEEFRLEHSRILNQKSLEGELCLSIHPLDYMTMSDNACDWDSCMSWQGEGCYRRGTVEMMNSPCVIVAYLNSTHPMKLYDMNGDRQDWSNKKWRQLFIFDPNWGIASVKSYPYFNESITKAVIEWIKELDIATNGSEYREEIYRINENDEFKLELDEDTTIDLYFDTDVMYNDFSCTDHFFAIKKNWCRTIECNYSGLDSCMWCGDGYGSYNDEDEAVILICDGCYSYTYCECCENRLNEDDAYTLDDVVMCEYCYEDRAKTCPITKEVHDYNNMIRLTLGALIPESLNTQACRDAYYHSNHYVYISVDADEDPNWKKYFNVDGMSDLFDFTINWWTNNNRAVALSQLTEKGIELFTEYYSKEELIERLKSFENDNLPF